MVPAGNKAKRFSSVNHTTKTIHHQYLLKNSPHELKGGTYFTIFISVQQVLSAYAVIGNYLWECFKIKRR